MKKLLVAITTFIMMTGVQSCDTQSCENVACPPNQGCYQGKCYCADGYEGDDCGTYSFEKYIGSYNVTETCSNGPSNFGSYSAYILATGDVRYVQIENLFNFGVSAQGTIRTNSNNKGNILEIPTQSSGGIEFYGEGTYDEALNRIYINFTYTFSGVSYDCQHTFYKI